MLSVLRAVYQANATDAIIARQAGCLTIYTLDYTDQKSVQLNTPEQVSNRYLNPSSQARNLSKTSQAPLLDDHLIEESE